MQRTTITDRHFQTGAGTAIVLAAAHVTIIKTGGYDVYGHMPLVLTLAVGVIAASRAIGGGTLTRGLAVVIGVALAAGELYNLSATLDRMIEAREEAQAPTRALHDKRNAALSALAKLEAAKPTSAALELAHAELAIARSGDEPASVTAARTAKEDANTKAYSEAANVACRTVCELKKAAAARAEQAYQHALSNAATATGTRITKAEAAVKTALADAVAKHESDVAAAKQVVADNPEPKSATPTADRLNWNPATWDLLMAALLSIGANGLAACLLAAGASRVPLSADNAQTSFSVETGTAGITAKQFLSERRSGSGSTLPGQAAGSPEGESPGPGGKPSGPKGGTRKARSEPQRRADLIAKEMRDRGEVPQFHIVRSEYRARFGSELPKVTAHRAVN